MQDVSRFIDKRFLLSFDGLLYLVPAFFSVTSSNGLHGACEGEYAKQVLIRYSIRATNATNQPHSKKHILEADSRHAQIVGMGQSYWMSM